MIKEDILQWLQEVQHPAKNDQDVVSLGMIDAIEVADDRIRVTLAFPKRPDPLKNYLMGAVQACLYRHAPGGTEIQVDTVVKDPAKPAPKGIQFNLFNRYKYPFSPYVGKNTFSSSGNTKETNS